MTTEDHHSIPFYRLTPNDVLKIMEKTPYESYFRLLSTSKEFKNLVHRCDRFKLVLPHNVKLIIEDSDDGVPTLIWEDHDWKPEQDSPVRFKARLDDDFCEFLQCLRFHHISIQAKNAGQIFKSCERLEKFFTGSRIRCTTLSLIEVESKETCWKLYQMLKPSRLFIRCAMTDGHELFKEQKFNLTYLQLHTTLEAAMPVMTEIIGTIPSIRVSYVSKDLDTNIFLNHILGVLKMSLKVPPKSCWHLRLSFSLYPRGFAQVGPNPSQEEFAQVFRGYGFNYTTSGEDNMNFEGVARLNRGEYMAEMKISKSAALNGNLSHNCTFAFELQHSINFNNADMQANMIRTN